MTVRWISHRGYCAQQTENTLESFQAAYDLGFRCLETDLRASLDGKIVLCHDDHLSRVAGLDARISQKIWSDLSKITLHNHAKLLRIEAFLAAFDSCEFIFDIKPESARKVAYALKSLWTASLARRVRFLFWNRADHQYFVELLGPIQTLATQRECFLAGLKCLMRVPWLPIDKGRTYAIPYRWGRWVLFKPEIIKKYRDHQLRVLAYLPENEDQARLALELGFDEILTDGRMVGGYHPP